MIVGILIWDLRPSILISFELKVWELTAVWSLAAVLPRSQVTYACVSLSLYIYIHIYVYIYYVYIMYTNSNNNNDTNKYN